MDNVSDSARELAEKFKKFAVKNTHSGLGKMINPLSIYNAPNFGVEEGGLRFKLGSKYYMCSHRDYIQIRFTGSTNGNNECSISMNGWIIFDGDCSLLNPVDWAMLRKLLIYVDAVNKETGKGKS